MKFVFFGTPQIAVEALNEMASFKLLPSLIVSNPDAPAGRKQTITPPPTKVWAEKHGIPVFQPTTLKNREELTPLTETAFDFFAVFAYGKMIPEWLLSLPKYGTINAHPSLLPKFRGASPIRSSLLYDLSACGVTIIQMDKELDHGPILTQEPIKLNFPIPGRELDEVAGKMCGDLLTHVMQELPKGNLSPVEQNHAEATFCSKITKDMAELQIDPYRLPTGDEALAVYKKICAFDGWPETFFEHNGKHIKIKSARLDDTGALRIIKIVPAGKAEMDFASYFK